MTPLSDNVMIIVHRPYPDNVVNFVPCFPLHSSIVDGKKHQSNFDALACGDEGRRRFVREREYIKRDAYIA